MTSSRPIYENPVELLQDLIRFDTTNPPGNERLCIEYINHLLQDAGIETTILARTPDRPNLVARLKGAGNAPPLLLYGHVDVVTTASQKWSHPPFEASIIDGYIWGRGALDMKHGVAMYLAAMLKAKAEGMRLPGDLIFAAVADEEAGSDMGANYLVTDHPQLFTGVRYAFSEFGAFNMTMAGRQVYPIMIAEKQTCWMKATFHGQGGHGSMPVRGQAMEKLSRAILLMNTQRLPFHVTPAVRLMIESIAHAVGGLSGWILKQSLNPVLGDRILSALGEKGNAFIPLLHNTVSPTMLQASDKVNVIPAEVILGIDGRLLPGFTSDVMVNELRHILGDDFDLTVVRSEPGPADPDMGLFNTLGEVMREMDPQGIPVPLVVPGVTDARFFSLLGIQTYGFTPIKLPPDFKFLSLQHAANERIPVEAMEFGLQAVYKAIQRFS